MAKSWVLSPISAKTTKPIEAKNAFIEIPLKKKRDSFSVEDIAATLTVSLVA